MISSFLTGMRRAGLTGLAMVAFSSFGASGPLAEPSPGVVIGPEVGLLPGVSPGELLLGELGCVSCHDAPSEVRARFGSRVSPVLGANGLQLTPQFMRAFLLNPAKEKPGTTMPDMLAEISDEKRSDSVDALVHYLVSISSKSTGANTGDSAKIKKGRELFHSIGCVACHAPEIRKAGMDPDALGHIKTDSVPFSNLAKKLGVSELSKFLRNPQQFRPSGRMPSLNLTEREANLLAVYLLREQSPETSNGKPMAARIPGLAYDYY